MKLLTTTGEIRKIEMTFAEIQKAVGGYVQTLKTNGGGMLLMNEDGLPLRLPKNPASNLFGVLLVGDLVLLEGPAEVKKVMGGSK